MAGETAFETTQDPADRFSQEKTKTSIRFEVNFLETRGSINLGKYFEPISQMAGFQNSQPDY